MKVVEIRNLCVAYNDKICKEAADWAGLYLMKQILRNIQIKMLKNSVNEAELWIPENIVKTIDRWFDEPRNNNRNNNNNNRNNNNRRRR